MKSQRFYCGLFLLFVFFLLPGRAEAVRADQPQRLASHAFVDDRGGLWMWGDNRYSSLAQPYIDPSEDDRSQSVDRIDAPIKVMDEVVSVSCGPYYTAAIKTDGTLWMWGDNSLGQLGNGGRANRGYVVRDHVWGNTTFPSRKETAYKYQDVPVKVMEDVAAVDCDGDVVTVIKTDGTLWTWGDNRAGRLSVGSDSAYKSTPVKLMDNVVAVSAGGGAVQADGTLWTWGDRYDLGDGQLHHPTSRPIKIGEGFRDVDMGYTSAAVKEDGSLWAWGRVDFGTMAGDVDRWDRAGSFPARYQTKPQKIMDDVASVYTDDNSMAAIRTDGTLWTWGQDSQGLLGVLPVDPEYPPMQGPQKIMDHVDTLYFGSGAMALQEDGSLWAWGRHSTFQTSYTSTASRPGTFSDGPLGDGYLPVLLSREVLFPPGETAEPKPQPDPEPLAVSTAGVDPQDAGTAYPTSQLLEIRDERVELPAYALRDASGGMTAYVRLRDLAWLLNGTAAQFDVGYDGQIALTPAVPYSGGAGDRAAFQGEQPYIRWAGDTLVAGQTAPLQAFVLTDEQGGGHTYYKLRDLGQVLGFNVGWTRERGMFLEPGRPYSADD